MKDEIKEIEEWLRDISTPTGLSYSGDRTLSNSMVDHIIDYITNLQEELDRCVKANIILDDENAELQGEKQNLQEENESLKAFKNESEYWENQWNYLYKRYYDYKERNEKAIEYITSEESINIFTSINAREKWLKINHKLLNILNGGDEE